MAQMEAFKIRIPKDLLDAAREISNMSGVQVSIVLRGLMELGLENFTEAHMLPLNKNNVLVDKRPLGEGLVVIDF